MRTKKNPRVNISLRKLSLAQILNFITQQVSFNYDVGDTTGTVGWSGSDTGALGGTLATDFFSDYTCDYDPYSQALTAMLAAARIHLVAPSIHLHRHRQSAALAVPMTRQSALRHSSRVRVLISKSPAPIWPMMVSS